MTATDALAELLDRLAAASDGLVFVTGDELAHWPGGAVAALQAARVLVTAGFGATATCPGCERACQMAMEVRTKPGHASQVFIACDKRDDIGRVPLGPGALERWRCSVETLADALARLLGSEAAARLGGDAPGWRLGVVAGQQARGVAVLRAGLVLDVAGHSLPVLALLELRASALVLDLPALRRCVDNPAAGAGAAESPEQRRQRLKARVQALKARGIKAFLKVLAEEEGLSASRLKQLLAEDKPVAATWATPVLPLPAKPKAGSKKGPRQH